MYNEIKNSTIKDLRQKQVEEWISDEIIDLVNDFGQNMSEDILKHTCQRLMVVLLTRYRSWAVGDVHAVFQTGMSGGYGTVHKVTVQKLFQWLKAAQQQRAVHTAIKSEAAPRTTEVPKTSDSDFGDFVLWCSYQTPRIYLTNLAPGWNPTRENFIIPDKIKTYMSEFKEAKEMDMLPALARRLNGVGVGI